MAFMVVAIANIRYTIGEDQFVIALISEQPVEVKCTWYVVRIIHFLEKIQNSFLVVPRSTLLAYLSSSMWLMSNLHRSQQLNLFRELPSRHAYDGHATTQSSSCLCKRCVLHGQNYHVNILSYNLRSSHLTTYKFPGASLWSLTYPS